METRSEKLFLLVFSAFIGVIATASVVVAKIGPEELQEISVNDEVQQADDKAKQTVTLTIEELTELMVKGVSAGVEKALKKPEQLSRSKKIRQSINDFLAHAWRSSLNAFGESNKYISPEMLKAIEENCQWAYGATWEYVIDPATNLVVDVIEVPKWIKKALVFAIIMQLCPGLSGWVMNQVGQQIPWVSWWFIKQGAGLGVQAVDGAVGALVPEAVANSASGIAVWAAQAANTLTPGFLINFAKACGY